MKYKIRIYKNYLGEESLVKTYKFSEMPFVPRKNDVILIDYELYKVQCVSICYDDYQDDFCKEIWFEIMVREADCDKEWWE